ncbi:RNA polymerase subunit sigma-70 [Actinophytocola gossypii]|uniref:RNA polymerase sigma factor n=1 Tax=Actinophytocola gossypii TaxID=2812003 RepID=A0ABT2J5R4_9PSEU|nr:RNA polymerase subunit sigma-70 [Actinophytocola gossypii]MCT2582835.1 RNA polymerase subunit sigma-70 [Actinophytocola gossypii]
MDALTEAEFAELTDRHRRELRVHCYRMLGNFEDAEDLVQETFLRAWRRRETYAGRASFRAWLYRIATNASLDLLERRPRPTLPVPTDTPPPAVAVPWLTPYPDALLPDEAAVSRETVELAFLAAVQYLPPRQRAVLVLRDVLGWSAKETAAQLDTTVAGANSALQRARETLRAHLPARRLDWSGAKPTEEELAVVHRYMDALERGADAELGTLLREDARCAQAPWTGGNMSDDPAWYSGRDTLIEAWQPIFHGPDRAEFRCVPTVANGDPAIATYIRPPGSGPYRAFGLDVLRIVDGQVAEITCFGVATYRYFDLPAEITAEITG